MKSRFSRVGALAVVAVLASACTQGPAPTANPSVPPAPTGTASPHSTPTAPPAVTQRFTFGPDAVVDTKLAGTSDLYINPGAVIEHDGVLHMFPNSFSKWPGRMLIPHLTSTDGGMTWTLDKKAKAIDTTDFKLAEQGVDVSTGFVTDDGTWVLIYETVSVVTPWLLARATAPSPEGPWTIEDAPILQAGPAGSFDAGGVAWPWVIRIGDRWAMYYAGLDALPAGKGSIGVAFSDDGKTWTKNDAPVLAATEQWEARTLDRPRVTQTSDGFAMVYTGRTLTSRGLATSPDGLTWAKVPGPNIEKADFPVEAQGSWDSAIITRGTDLVYFLEIGSATTKIYRATLALP